MQNYKLLVLAIVTIATAWWMWIDRTHMTLEPAAQNETAGQLAPDVTFQLLGDGSVALQSLKGKTVLLHFWASWCVPCRKEFPELLKAIGQSDNTVLLAVSADAKAKDAEEFLAPFKREFKPLFSSGKVILAHDPARTLIEGTFQTYKYPETIIIAPDLTMRRKIMGE